MIRIDKDALICDLAENYGIFDYKALPVTMLATLAVGLREESRIKMRLSGRAAPRRDVLLAAAVDRLSLLVWQISGAGAESKPASVMNAILKIKKETPSEAISFESPADFDAEWKRRTGVSHGTE